jgi:hypothetical protein
MSKMIGTEFAETIDRLQKGESDAWRERAKARHLGDQKTSEAAAVRMVAFNKELMAALKTEGLKYEAELKADPAENEEEKVTRLLTAFARGARLTRIWNDTMHQERIGFCCAKKISKQILPELDALNRRGDVVIFLDDPDLSVRAKAASWLLDTMPDRCLPILREIDRTERALNAGWIACWALDAYERRTAVKSA